MKYCAGCRQDKHESEFASSNRQRGTLQKRCKACVRQYDSIRTKRPSYLLRKRMLQRAIRTRNQRFVQQYIEKSGGCCKHCPEIRRPCLQFHHKNRATKRGNVADMIRRGVGLAVLKKELDKCDILCANCHCMQTASSQNWHSLGGSQI